MSEKRLVSCQVRTGGMRYCCRAHLHLSKLLLVLRTPSQRLSNTRIQQRLPNPAHANKRIDIHQVLHVLFARQLLRTIVVPMPQQVIRQQPIQPLPAPSLILDVFYTVHCVQLIQVLYPRCGLGVQPAFLVGVGAQLALHATHAADHGVEVLEHILLRGPAGDGCGRGVAEERFECRGVLFDGEVGCSEVFA